MYPKTQQKWTDLKGEISKSTIIVGTFSVPLSIINRNREKIRKYKELNNTTNQLDLIDIQDTPTQTSRIQILFKYTQDIHSDHTLDYKTLTNNN